MTFTDRYVLPGAGATEIALAGAIRSHVDRHVVTHPHYKRILKGFSKALDYIPVCLAENADFERADINIALGTIKIEFEQQEMLPVHGLDLESLTPIKIPSDHQIFDSYFPKIAALNLAIDTAGLLIRIDRIVKGSNLLAVQPISQAPEKEAQENQELQTQSLYPISKLSSR